MRAFIRGFGLLALVLAGISANGQNLHEIKVNVPFTFTAAGKELVPGEYHLFLNAWNAVVTLRGEDSTSLCLMMSASSDFAQDGRSFVRFYSYGEHYSLQEVAFAGAVRRVASAHADKVLTAEPAAPDKKSLGAATTPSLVILSAEAEN